LSNIASAKTAAVSSVETSAKSAIQNKLASIRVSPNSYLTVLFLTTFFSGFLFYLESDFFAISLFITSWLIFPFLAWNDRITFDGKRLERTGILPKFWAKINNSKFHLRISDIEQVETQALRALKRGGNVFYRYRTSIQGKNLRFVFASGGEEYRQMIHKLFPLLSENLLDNRSIELRDYLTEPKETLMKAEFAKIPSAEVLESSPQNRQKFEKRNNWEIGEDSFEKAESLRKLANELRISGYLIQALEAFRRALVLNPKDAWLLFEFARCLHSYAGSERDEKLQKKAFAALRLAEKRGENDGDFLERLGESYFQYGDWHRAYKVFNRAIDVAEESFRSVRGLAEIALREGKIAHVIHNFGIASRLAETPALKRWTQSENEYFARLNSDEEYMELEVSRVNMLETLENARKISLNIALFSFPLILFGLIFEEQFVTNVGWAISSVALLIWVGLILSRNLLSNRIPVELVEED
jgi:tetratricopeptide (TPR) repeat protein